MDVSPNGGKCPPNDVCKLILIVIIESKLKYKFSIFQPSSGGGPPSGQSGPPYSCVRADNLPLNPNSNVTVNTKSSHFDPISSLAQMSQQLTSNVSSSLNGGAGGAQPGGMMGGVGFNNHGMVMGDMNLGGPHSNMPSECMGGNSGVLDNNLMGNPGMMGNNPGPGVQVGYGGMSVGAMQMSGPRSMSPKLMNQMSGFPGGGTNGPGGGLGPGGNMMMQPRLMGRPPMGGIGGSYNGANIQVKASAPNTIQYLPARPQVGNTNPRGPPSLDFLQRFANPMQSMDGNGGPINKMQPQSGVGQGGMPSYFQNCNQGPMGNAGGGVGNQQNMMGMSGGPPGPMDGNENMIVGQQMGGMMGPGPGQGNNPVMMGPQGIIMRGLRPPLNQGTMMRMQGPPPPHAMMGHQFNNGPTNGNEQMFQQGGAGGPPNSQMFVTGNSKGSPMGGGGPPDTTQPLPPSMGGQNQQNPGGGGGPNQNNFKSSQFVGPTTTDPNYAQQYHNFQQQLYATNTRSQLTNNQGVGGGGGQTYFVPK